MRTTNYVLSMRFLLVGLAICTILSPAMSAKDKDREECEDVEIVLQTIVDFSTFTAQGVVAGDLKGSVSFVGDPTSVAPVTGQVFPPTADALSFTGELTFFTKHGSLTTRNVGVFQPGPFAVGVEFGTVVAGTGKYSDASGVISFAVEADETGTQFSEIGTGTICQPDDRGHRGRR